MTKTDYLDTGKTLGKIKRTCKKCGKDFYDDHYINYCRKCFGEDKRQNMKEYAKHNHQLKEKWIGRLGMIKAQIAKEPKWDDEYFEARSTQPCIYCKEHHFKNSTYFHPYKQEITVLGLPVHEIKELIQDYKRELNKENITVKQFLEKRGLEIKQVIE